MKHLLLTVAVLSSVHSTCVAQFNFRGALKNAGRQVRGQVEREIRRQAPQVVHRVIRNNVKRYPLPQPPKHNPKPCPRPTPHPFPEPPVYKQPPVYPQPHPRPAPCPIRPLPHPGYETPSCSIRPVAQPAAEAPHPEPAAQQEPAADLPQVEAGQHVTIDGKLLGSDTGAVAVKIGPMVLEAEILEWSSTQTTAVLPLLPLNESTQATVVVLTAHGRIAESLDVELMPSTAEPVADTPAERPVVAAGQQVSLEAADMGSKTGKVQVVVGGLTLNADVAAWNEGETTAVLPVIRLAEAVPATVRIVAADGRVVDQIEVLFAPATDVAQQN